MTPLRAAGNGNMLDVLSGIGNVSQWGQQRIACWMEGRKPQSVSLPRRTVPIPSIQQPMRFLSSAARNSRTPHDSRGRAWAARSVQVRQHWQVSARASHGDSQEPGKDV